MFEIAELGKKLWSLISPVPVAVRMVSRQVPTGQVEFSPEFLYRGGSLNPEKVVSGGSHPFINGYRASIPDHVRAISQEYYGKRVRIRPRAVRDWIKKYEREGIPIVDSESGRPFAAVTAQVELDLSDRIRALPFSVPSGVMSTASVA